MRPRSKSETRDTHALGHAPLQRQTRPLVGGVSCPLQWVPFLLAMPMTLPLPPSAAAAKTEAAAKAAESVRAAAGAMETEAVAAAAAAAAAVAAAAAAVEEDAKAEAAEAATAAAATTELVEVVEAVEPEAVGAGAEPGAVALLSSMSLSPLLLLGLLLAGAVSHAARAPLLHGCRARNSIMSKVSRTGIGPTRRWLILGWLAVVSGFHLPEDNGAVAQIDADVTPLSPHESTITGEVDGARDRRQLSGWNCDGGWYDSPPRLIVPPSRNPAAASLFAATQHRILKVGRAVIATVFSAVIATATHPEYIIRLQAVTAAATRVRGAALMNIRRAVIIWLAPFLSAYQMESSSLLLAGTLNVLRARTVQAARSMVAQTVPRARTAEHARVLAPPVPRASTAHPLARLIQATASTVPRASTAHPLARLIQAPAPPPFSIGNASLVRL